MIALAWGNTEHRISKYGYLQHLVGAKFYRSPKFVLHRWDEDGSVVTSYKD